ncbi:putative DNA gyrase subunit B [Erwinia phage pEa_SNUABM_5]|uniref:DNA topoisomerase (ATP-hydrolyzing) n=1 Tax=Erwinia phage pEa_SNUABM_5 TaxID=2797313 RepID=A0A7T8EPT6_9CAUD|nr:putative DNA gyrase subunit B [Erwinia phage pEa_SNUABM_5]QQO90485.1 putative DNA gyrase subunit B [Erwinia phage pEa_SNUABM_5]
MAKAAKPTKKKDNGGSQEGFVIAEGLDGIRLNPGMYMGEQGADMAYRAVKEPVDNVYDELMAGRCRVMEVVIDYDNDINIVADQAGGIPTDFKVLKDGTKETVMTAAFSRVHAGGKFNDKAYKTSAGTHGVGVAALNAISSQLRVWSMYKGGCAYQMWQKGEAKSGKDPKKVKSIDKDVMSLLREKKHSKYGTVVAWSLDQDIVSADAKRGKKLAKGYRHAAPDPARIGQWLRNMSMLNPGFEIHLTLIKKGKRKEFTFHNKKDLTYVVKTMCAEREIGMVGKPLVFKNDYVTVALAWTDHVDADNFLSFVNASPTVDGGWHVVGFRDALFEAIKPHMKEAKGKSKKKQGFKQEDLLIGLTGMFDWRMHGASYTSQVKDKLATRVEKEVYEMLKDQLMQYFKDNKKVASTIIKRAEAMNKGREELSAVVKSMADTKKKLKGNALPADLIAANNCKPHERELIVVEGDSAGGTATDARNPDYQEVMLAGGKPLNGLKASLADVLKHKEVQGMLISIGADLKTLDPKAENPVLSVDKLRIGNLLFLMDADPDGFHIATLFLGVVYRLLPDMFREGRVWIIDSPLYNVVHKGIHYGGMTFEECRAKAPSAVKDRDIVRAKGWGEVEPDVLEAIAFNPKTRRLIRVNPFENKEQERFFRGILAEDAVHRRRLLGLEEAVALV